MKSLALFILLLSSTTALKSQFSDQYALYVSSDWRLGYLGGQGFAVNFIRHKAFSAQIGWSKRKRKSPHTPSGYQSSILHPGGGPTERGKGMTLLLGHAFELAERRNLRLNILGGISMYEFTEASQFEAAPLLSFPNYTYSYRDARETSWLVQANLEFPITEVIGYTMYGRLSFGEFLPSKEVGVGIMFGLLRSKLPN